MGEPKGRKYHWVRADGRYREARYIPREKVRTVDVACCATCAHAEWGYEQELEECRYWGTTGIGRPEKGEEWWGSPERLWEFTVCEEGYERRQDEGDE